jgi:hypothetical protein
MRERAYGTHSVSRRDWLGYVAIGAGLTLLPKTILGIPAPIKIITHRNPGCTCCEGWAEHMRKAGFEVTLSDDPELAAYREKLGVPSDLAGCHTSTVGARVFEGHIPSHLIARFLRDHPAALGLAVAGMPAGSPGMESPTPVAYDVVAFAKDGKRWIYENVKPAAKPA